MTCFVKGCQSVITGRCKTWGEGCKAHLDRWATSAARRICQREPSGPRNLSARSEFMRLMVDEETRDKERRLAREAARDAENQAVPL